MQTSPRRHLRLPPAAVGSVAVDGFSGRANLDAASQRVVDVVDPKSVAVTQVKFRFADMYGLQTAYVLSGSATAGLRLDAAHERVAASLADLHAMPASASQRTALSDVATGYVRFATMDAEVRRLVAAGRGDAAMVVVNVREQAPYEEVLSAGRTTSSSSAVSVRLRSPRGGCSVVTPTSAAGCSRARRWWPLSCWASACCAASADRCGG